MKIIVYRYMEDCPDDDDSVSIERLDVAADDEVLGDKNETNSEMLCKKQAFKVSSYILVLLSICIINLNDNLHKIGYLPNVQTHNNLKLQKNLTFEICNSLRSSLPNIYRL